MNWWLNLITRNAKNEKGRCRRVVRGSYRPERLVNALMRLLLFHRYYIFFFIQSHYRYWLATRRMEKCFHDESVTSNNIIRITMRSPKNDFPFSKWWRLSCVPYNAEAKVSGISISSQSTLSILFNFNKKMYEQRRPAFHGHNFIVLVDGRLHFASIHSLQ